jgi:hypothetical protein
MLSEHDNHVHAVRLAEGEDGAGDLELDIDHIPEWLPEGESFRYPSHRRDFVSSG